MCSTNLLMYETFCKLSVSNATAVNKYHMIVILFQTDFLQRRDKILHLDYDSSLEDGATVNLANTIFRR